MKAENEELTAALFLDFSANFDFVENWSSTSSEYKYNGSNHTWKTENKL